jgi:hypothetical protein
MRVWISILLAATFALASAVSAQEWKGRARIEGRVTGEADAPLRGATVAIDRLSSAGSIGPRVSSDREGRWLVDGIASGSWMVVVAAPGYRTRQIGVHLPSESSWLGPLDVRLTKQSAPSTPAASTRAAAPPPKVAESTGGRATSADIEAVLAALDAGRIDRARGLLPSLDADGSENAGDFFDIGRVFLTAGATDEAAACFSLAIALDPSHVEAHYRRGLALLALGRHGEARSDFEAVVDLRPDGTLAANARKALDALENGQAGE